MRVRGVLPDVVTFGAGTAPLSEGPSCDTAGLREGPGACPRVPYRGPVLPQPGDAFGRYDVDAWIGRGGMGVVLRATHRDLERQVALKVLAPEIADDPAYRNRFLREARTLARLDSPHVVRVFDAGEQDGSLFIATELVPDGDLADLLAQRGPLPLADAVEVLGQVAEGLQAAHDAGILHRDIKPSNVLLRRMPDGRLRAVLCDLGIATVAGAEHTSTQGVIGTPSYMSPERLEGAEATVASDIYALGCLAWAVLTGQAPYVGTAGHVVLSHLQAPIPQLPATTPDAVALNGVLTTAMAKQPSARHRSAAEFATALARVPVAATSAETTIVAADIRGRAPVAQATPSPAPTSPGPQPPPTPPAPPGSLAPPGPLAPPEAEPRPRRSGTIAIVLAVVGVLLVSAAVTALVLGGRDDDPDEAADEAGTSGSVSSGDSKSPSSGSPASDGPASDGPAALLTCWKGPPSASCPAVRGAGAMAWVFPGSGSSDCVPNEPAAPRLASTWCTVGDEYVVHYSQWPDWASMNGYYAAKALRTLPLRSDVHGARYDGETRQGTYWEVKVAAWYVDRAAPWSVTVYAHDLATAERVYGDLGTRDGADIARGATG